MAYRALPAHLHQPGPVCWLPSVQRVCGVSYNPCLAHPPPPGALHLWRRQAPSHTNSDTLGNGDSQPRPAACTPSSSPGPWVPQHALGGHFGAVVDCGWGLDGGCLVSVSEDQTARVHTHTHMSTGGGEAGGGTGGEGQEQRKQQRLHWCEVARSQVGVSCVVCLLGRAVGAGEEAAGLSRGCNRHWRPLRHDPPSPAPSPNRLNPFPWPPHPQIHGHDFSCLAHVPTAPPATFTYVSGSEEKVLRVLEAPQVGV